MIVIRRQVPLRDRISRNTKFLGHTSGKAAGKKNKGKDSTSGIVKVVKPSREAEGLNALVQKSQKRKYIFPQGFAELKETYP